jgi:hypothetical protein
MFRYVIPFALTLACSAPALAEPEAPPAFKSTTTDQLLFWGMYQLTPDKADKYDMCVYMIRNWWLTPTSGVYGFVNTQQSGTLRYMAKTPLGLDVTATGMAGARAAVMGNAPPVMAPGFRLGPELAVVLSRPLVPTLSLSAMSSLAYLFPMNTASTERSRLVFYSVTLGWDPMPDTTLSLGVMGSFMDLDTTGRAFHNLGPTLTGSRKF